LQKDAKGFLSPARLSLGLPLAGEVCAGFPSPAEEELRDVISFDDYLVAHPETSFLLSVTGDSMIGEGIMEKDLVIVERGREPKNGDIILAEVDGNWTMKYFRKKRQNGNAGGGQSQISANYPQRSCVLPASLPRSSENIISDGFVKYPDSRMKTDTLIT